MQQIDFLPSGCQFWYKSIIGAQQDMFMFCSSLTHFFYDFKSFTIKKIISESAKTIIAMAWNPKHTHLMASIDQEQILYIWNVDEEKVERKVTLDEGQPIQIEWSPIDGDNLVLIYRTGMVQIYNYQSNRLSKLASFGDFYAHVFRFSSNVPNYAAFGLANGQIRFFDTRKKKSQKMIFKEFPPVEDLQWDPNSDNYLLACWQNGIMQLIDAEKKQTMQMFDRQNQGITTIAWVKSVPGGFITSNKKLAGIKIWNVSNRSPLKTLRVGISGILNMISLRHINSHKDSFLMSFRNGQVGVFNYPSKKFSFITEPNHSETIFDAKFQQSNMDILATASFDGDIRLWDVNKMKCMKQLKKYKSKSAAPIIYAVSWAPQSDMLVSCNFIGEVVVWDTNKAKVISVIQPGDSKQIYRVEWNQLNDELIASGHSDGCWVLQKIPHKSTVYGVAWSPHDPNTLATATLDGVITIFEIKNKHNQILSKIRAHQKKIFNIAWNPIIKNILASGSDDQTVKIWKTLAKQEMCTLQGHTAPVRALFWNTELPWLLLTGSWDSSIRMWDVRTGQCIHQCSEHIADVYALASHESRPFIYVSSSRDTTVRMWTLQNLVQPLLNTMIVSQNWSKLLGQGEDQFHQKSTNQQLQLCGETSHRLIEFLQECQQDNNKLTFYKEILQFFKLFHNQKDFWDILNVIINGEIGDQNNEIQYIDEIHSSYMSKAQELESTLQSKQFTYSYLDKRGDKMKKSADMYLKIGEFEHYCECLCNMGKWEKALAFAPRVSMEFWKQLSARYADYLDSESSKDTPPYLILSNQITKAVEYFMKRNQFEDSFLICAMKNRGHLVEEDPYEMQFDTQTTQGQSTDTSTQRSQKQMQNKLINKLGQINFGTGQSVKAAAYHLSVKDYQGCIVKLLRGNELEYALVVSELLDIQDAYLKTSELLALKLLNSQQGQMGMQLLQNTKHHDFIPVYEHLCGQKQSGNFSLQSNNLYQESMNAISQDQAEEMASVLIQKASQCLQGQNLHELPEVLRGFQAFQIANLSQVKQSIQKEFLAYSLYFGMKNAQWRGMAQVYRVILPFLRQHLLENKNLGFPFSTYEIEFEGQSYLGHLDQKTSYKKFNELKKYLQNSNKINVLPLIQKNIFNACNFIINHFLQSEIFLEIKESQKLQLESQMNKNQFQLLGDNLPHNTGKKQENQRSYLDDQRQLQGHVFELGKKGLKIPLQQALMWAQTVGFSPLKTGQTINPY